MMRRGEMYYAIVASDCCFCAQGSSAIVYTASDPLGPWTRHNDINSIAASVDEDREVANSHRRVSAQQSFVLEVPQPDGMAYLWGGDRWQSADDGFKSHDYQVWLPLVFNETGGVEPLEWVDNWTLTLPQWHFDHLENFV